MTTLPNNTEDGCLMALQDSYEEYLRYSSQSTKKLIPLHGWVIIELRKLLGADYEVIGIEPGQNKEIEIDGKIYKKDVDVAVRIKNKNIGVVSIKFVCSNYRKNANNYLETQIGETTNIRSSGIIYGSLLFFRHPIPYIEKGKTERWEYLKDDDIEKYYKLLKVAAPFYSPDAQGLIVAYAGETNNSNEDRIVRICNKNDLNELSDKKYDILNNIFNINMFFDTFVKKINKRRSEMKI